MSAATIGRVVAGVVAYLEALDGGTPADSGLPTAASLGGNAGPTASDATRSDDEAVPME